MFMRNEWMVVKCRADILGFSQSKLKEKLPPTPKWQVSHGPRKKNKIAEAPPSRCHRLLWWLSLRWEGFSGSDLVTLKSGRAFQQQLSIWANR